MILYRNIGQTELAKLMSGKTIYGQCTNKKTKTPVVCFYNTPFLWKDSSHQYLITIQIAENDPRIQQQTEGIYHVSENFDFSKAWNENTGNKEIRVPEILLVEYSVADIRSIKMVH